MRGWGQKTMLAKATALVSIVLCSYQVLFISGLLPRLGIYVMLLPHIGVTLGFILVLTFLIFPARKGASRDKLPWYDFLFIFGAIAGTGYYAFFHDTVYQHLTTGLATNGDIILFVTLCVVMFEAARRVVGLAMPIIVAGFLLYNFTSEYFPGFLHVQSPGLSRVVVGIYLGYGGIFGIVMQVVATVIIMFLIFSQFLLESGAGRFFIDLALSLVGHVRGGAAKAAIFASAFMATMSGSISGNVAATGSITIPLMKSIGYKPHFAAAVEAAASTEGVITPPVMGAIAFIMAELTGIPYTNIILAAAVPAFLYFFALFVQVDLEAVKTGLRGLPRDELPSLRKTLKEGWFYLIPIIVLVVFLALRHPPAQAALYAIASIVLVTIFNKQARMKPKKIMNAFVDTGGLICTVGVASALVGIILGTLDITGVGIRLAGGITSLAGGNFLLLGVMTAMACFILGMGMTVTPIYIMLAVLVAPALIEGGGVTVMAAHLFIIYWGVVSFVTPPVAIAAYVGSAIAQSDPMQTAWQATRLAIVAFVVPFIFLYEPAILLIGSPADVALALVSAMVGVYLLAVGVEGYFLRPLNWVQRTVLIVGGIAVIAPTIIYTIIGLSISMFGLLPQILRMNKSRIKRGN